MINISMILDVLFLQYYGISRAFLAEMGAKKEIIIINVHGTFDSDSNDVGSRWWQNSSNFQCAIQNNIGGDRFSAYPFHWSGRNSEYDRLKAARKLSRVIIHLGRKQKKFTVIAHSHGGNILYISAIRFGGVAKYLSKSGLFITLGTPYFNQKRTLLGKLYFLINFISMLTSIPVSFMFLISLISVFWPTANEISNHPVQSYERWLFPFGAFCCVFALFSGWRNSFSPVISSILLMKWSKLIEDRWISIWSIHDEVISSLSLAIKNNINIVNYQSARRSLILLFRSATSIAATLVCAFLTFATFSNILLSKDIPSSINNVEKFIIPLSMLILSPNISLICISPPS